MSEPTVEVVVSSPEVVTAPAVEQLAMEVASLVLTGEPVEAHDGKLDRRRSYMGVRRYYRSRMVSTQENSNSGSDAEVQKSIEKDPSSPAAKKADADTTKGSKDKVNANSKASGNRRRNSFYYFRRRSMKREKQAKKLQAEAARVASEASQTIAVGESNSAVQQDESASK